MNQSQRTGIGDSIHTLDDLRDIPKPIKVSPEIGVETTKQDKIVLDALWSDPTDSDSVLGVQNSPRGLLLVWFVLLFAFVVMLSTQTLQVDKR